MKRALACAAMLAWLAPAAALAAPLVDAVIYTTRGEVPLRLELAANPQTRAQGLMERDGLAPADGMLFLFPAAHDYTFWMKNTRMPLDMLFICDKRHIAYIEERAAPYSLTARSAARDDIVAVIELDGGRAAREGIARKDFVRYELPDDLEIR